jgi:hypothetical protein
MIVLIDPDTLPADTAVAFGPEHFRAADAAGDQHEALMCARLLDQLRDAGLGARSLRALASHPAETSHLVRVLDVANFTRDPKADAQSRVQTLLAALQAGSALAAALGAAGAGEASGEARRAATVVRDARILKLWATTNAKLSDPARAKTVRTRLGRHAPSVRTILRVVKAAGK